MICKPVIRKVIALCAASSVTVGMSLLGVGAVAAHAANTTASEPVTFTVASGSLALSEPVDGGTALLSTATPMPLTTVTDGRNLVGVANNWTATNVASDLLDVVDTTTITASNIAMAQTGGAFTAGTGTGTVVNSAGSVAVTGDTINSVYTYTPTALLSVPATATAGSYAGTVTQTVS